MNGERVRLCMELDPLPSTTSAGRRIHRHCLLAVDHAGWHRSRDARGRTVHEWRWQTEQNRSTDTGE